MSNDASARLDLIRKLFVAFPLGATPERVDYYAQETAKIPLLDLAAGVARAGLTLETSRAPSLATLLRLVGEVKNESLVQRDDARLLTEPKPRPFTADEQEQAHMVTELGRAGWYWCLELGKFVSGGKHRSGHQLHWQEEAGMVLCNVTREQIHAAHGEHCGEIPF
jgi:hypothetical protein